MGEYLDGSLRCFQPDNTDTKLHIETNWSGITLEELVDQAKDHFGEDVRLDQIEIEAENIHTRCLGLDYHDYSDWTDFLVLTRKEDAAG